MEKIYIVLTYTGTFLSKVIKLNTKKEYSHVSIALDKKLEQMYSFARLNPYNPFRGGFMHEIIDEGVFKRFKNTKSIVYSLEVEDINYKKINELINEFEKNKNYYKFNIIGLLAIGFNIRLERKNYLYCAEFVKKILDESGLDLRLPEMITPEDFRNMKGIDIIYEGLLREYNQV